VTTPRFDLPSRSALALSGLTMVLALAAVVPRAQAPAQPPAPGAAGPPPQDTQQPPKPTFKAEANYIRVDVYPTHDGKAVRDLTAAEFELFEDGAPQKIETFEHVEIQGGGPQTERREPSSVREARAMAEDSRARIIVVFLDTYYTEISGSHRMQRALVTLLNQILGPDDLFAVMTPEMSATDIALARRTETIEGMLSRYWYWGKRDRIADNDPEEEQYEQCFPENSMPRECPDPTDPRRERKASQSGATYAGVAREMIQRRREKRVIDAMTDLATYLGGVREERKAVIAVSDGWLLYRPNQALARIGLCDRPGGISQVGVGPDGRLTTDRRKAEAGGSYSAYDCETDRQFLANLDNYQQFQDLLGLANRMNVSFYPVDSRGLPAVDTPIGPEHPLPPRADQSALAHRIEMLRTLAENTDGLAVVNNNDIERGMRRIADDLTSYYLLGYYSTNTAFDGKYRSIKVRVKRAGVDVRARRGYRAASAAEITASKTTAQSAAAAAPATAVQAAIGSLAGLRTDIKLRTGVSYLTSSQGGRLWATVEIDAALARQPDWVGGGDIELVLSSGKEKLGEKTVPLPPGNRIVVADLPDVAGLSGELSLRTRVRSARDGLPLLDTLRFSVTPSTTAVTVGPPRLLRRGPTTGLEYVPTADQRFRRTERFRLEVPVAGLIGTTSAELLDRSGQAMAVPVKVSQRPEEGAGFTWVVADLTLAPLAPGDYAVKTIVEGAGSRQERITAFRLVP
jgi:VWFA-related protein